MTLYAENEANEKFPFSLEEIAKIVAESILEAEGCPYEATVNLLLTDNKGIREFNREYRNIDRETDVLSFPNLDFERPGDFRFAEEHESDRFDPDSGRYHHFRRSTKRTGGELRSQPKKGICFSRRSQYAPSLRIRSHGGK